MSNLERSSQNLKKVKVGWNLVINVVGAIDKMIFIQVIFFFCSNCRHDQTDFL